MIRQPWPKEDSAYCGLHDTIFRFHAICAMVYETYFFASNAFGIVICHLGEKSDEIREHRNCVSVTSCIMPAGILLSPSAFSPSNLLVLFSLPCRRSGCWGCNCPYAELSVWYLFTWRFTVTEVQNGKASKYVGLILSWLIFGYIYSRPR